MIVTVLGGKVIVLLSTAGSGVEVEKPPEGRHRVLFFVESRGGLQSSRGDKSLEATCIHL